MTQTEIRKFKKRLQEEVDFNKEMGDDPEARCWGAQEGVLISSTEAQYILNKL